MAIKKIMINSTVESILENYKAQLRDVSGKYYVVERLDTIIDEMNQREDQQLLVEYLDLIRHNYEKLLSLPPWEYNGIIEQFEDILPQSELTNSIVFQTFNSNQNRSTNAQEISIYELIVNIMDYKRVQKTLFPSIIRKLNIKTCVYCNTQFAIATDDNNAYFQLDHCFPKSKFPYFCTSFFNLQPSCSSCNQRKSQMDPRFGPNKEYNLSIWKKPDEPNTDFHISIDKSSLVQYLKSASSHDAEMLNILFGAGEATDDTKQQILETLNTRFHLADQYNYLKDVAEEVIWRHLIYSKGYYSGIEKEFSDLFPNIKSQVDRLIYGNYLSEEEIYKRPLSKFMQDIKKQLEEDMEE